MIIWYEPCRLKLHLNIRIESSCSGEMISSVLINSLRMLKKGANFDWCSSPDVVQNRRVFQYTLGKGSNNQKGNLWCFFPRRGGGSYQKCNFPGFPRELFCRFGSLVSLGPLLFILGLWCEIVMYFLKKRGLKKAIWHICEEGYRSRFPGKCGELARIGGNVVRLQLF